MNLGINTGPKTKPPDPPKPPDAKSEGLGEHLNGCAFVIVYFLLVCIAGVSGFVCFLSILASERAAHTSEVTIAAFWLCFTVALAGLAICSRPRR